MLGSFYWLSWLFGEQKHDFRTMTKEYFSVTDKNVLSEIWYESNQNITIFEN